MGKLILKKVIEKVLRIKLDTSSGSTTGFRRQEGGQLVKQVSHDDNVFLKKTYDNRKKKYEKSTASRADLLMEYFDCKSPGDCDNWQGAWGSMIQDITDILADVPGLSSNLKFSIIIKFTPKQKFLGTNSHASIQIHDQNYEYGYQVGLWQGGDVRLEPLRRSDPTSKDKIFYTYTNTIDVNSLRKVTAEIQNDLNKEYIYQWVPLEKGFMNCATWAVRMANIAGHNIPREFGWLLHSTWQLKETLEKRKSFSRTILVSKEK
jgi:hypothetical protein